MMQIPYILFAGIVVFLVIVISISGTRNLVREPFLSSLIGIYKAEDDQTHGIDFKMRYIGWTQAGRVFSRTSGLGKIGFDDEALYIRQMFLAARSIPTIRIPVDCLSLVDSKLVWTAFSKVDVFDIDGINEGQILLPMGAVAEYKSQR